MDGGLGPEMTGVGRGAHPLATLVPAVSGRRDGQAKGKNAARNNAIARSGRELDKGGRVEDQIRSEVLTASEEAWSSRWSTMSLEDPRSEAAGSALPGDELQIAYEQAVHRAAEWYRSRLSELNAEPHQGAV